jgi:hypothetical protein
MRKRLSSREATVRVVGRISAATRPDAIFQTFVQACQQNSDGLVVETVTGFQRKGGRDADGSFELEFRPGWDVVIVSEDGSPISQVTLREAGLEEGEEPSYIEGRRADGVLQRIPREQVGPKQWRELVTELGGR